MERSVLPLWIHRPLNVLALLCHVKGIHRANLNSTVSPLLKCRRGKIYRNTVGAYLADNLMGRANQTRRSMQLESGPIRLPSPSECTGKTFLGRATTGLRRRF